MSFSVHSFFLISLLICFDCLPAMRSDVELQGSWDYKQRDMSCLHNCYPKSDEQKYPYFLFHTEDKYAQRSLLDDLLFAKRVLEKNILKEVTSVILHYSYLIEQHRDRKLIDKYTKVFYKENFDLLYLNQMDKQTLLYVLYDGLKKNNEIKIEGRDKDFAQKMVHNILVLPLPIKKRMISIFGPEIMGNINYKPLWRNILLDDQDNREHCHACTYAMGATCCCVTLYSYIFYGSKDIWGWMMLKKSITLASIILGRMIEESDYRLRQCLALSISTACAGGCGCGMVQIIKYLLEKCCPEKDKRHGFQDIRLLQEMECNVIDL